MDNVTALDMLCKSAATVTTSVADAQMVYATAETEEDKRRARWQLVGALINEEGVR